MNRKALGKGIGALIPDFDLEAEEQSRPEGGELLIDEISPNPLQPRKYFDDEKLEELTRSIQENGVLQPVIVQKTDTGYELIMGERRWRASKKAGLKKIPAIVRNATNTESLKWALVENVNRQDLNPIEEAEAFSRLAEEYGLTQDKIAQAMGKSRAAVANTLRLLKLPRRIKENMIAGSISMGHARALLGLESAKEMEKLMEQILVEGLTVRQIEERVNNHSARSAKGKVKKVAQKDIFVKEFEREMSGKLGSKVELKPGKNGGKLIISYYSLEDLERLRDLEIPKITD